MSRQKVQPMHHSSVGGVEDMSAGRLYEGFNEQEIKTFVRRKRPHQRENTCV
ncbi:hypothetical protein F7725_010972 [Dissostichus mawsoni]|uniref:Uncharacterized protein n=1 Tax=Dissostichus mawsoni TaxID=36200 RepID=A0A7J5Z9C0_DISMA|nr:hypothetical protein F7725_010972 [Dissostichus mawsoni]